jgi:hypothetical protein
MTITAEYFMPQRYASADSLNSLFKNSTHSFTSDRLEELKRWSSFEYTMYLFLLVNFENKYFHPFLSRSQVTKKLEQNSKQLFIRLSSLPGNIAVSYVNNNVITHALIPVINGKIHFTNKNKTKIFDGVGTFAIYLNTNIVMK